jgi:Mor family transcriptional regulator
MKFYFKDAKHVRGIHANGISVPKLAKTFNMSEETVRLIVERRPPYHIHVCSNKLCRVNSQ